MKRFARLQKYMALVGSVLLLVSMIPLYTFAAPTIDFNTTGSLTINKYDEALQGQPIPDVTFTIYKVLNMSEDNLGQVVYTFVPELEQFFIDNGLSADDVAQMESSELSAIVTQLIDYIDNEYVIGTSASTNTSGQLKFNDLSLGLYLVNETAYPDQVVAPAAPFFVSIPMIDETGSNWIYDVVANPKNVTGVTTGTMTLTKYGLSGPNNIDVLPGATFQLYKFNEKTFALELVTDNLVTDQNGQIGVSGLTRGVYTFKEKEAPEGYILEKSNGYKFRVVWNDVTKQLEYQLPTQQGKSLNIQVTNEKPIINKELTSNNDANFLDLVSWKITASVPKAITDLATYKITDKISAGLTYDSSISDLVVKNGDRTLQENVDYREFYNSASGELMITFENANLVSGQDIVITYLTRLNANAVLAGEGNENEVYLEYSTAPTGDSTYTIKPSSDPRVFTYGLKLVKENSSNQKLAGAEFDLFDSQQNKVNSDKLITDENGLIIVNGLATGDYSLVETKAPTGYNLLTQPVNFSISAEYGMNNQKEVMIVSTNTVDGYLELSVVNNKGIELPTTGGIGAVIFTISGLTLMGIAGGAYFVSKRKDKE